MIYFDVTKTKTAGHRSGLMRVSERLLEELGPSARAVSWDELPASLSTNDWFLTPELFSEAERPGFGEFLRARRCRCAAIFHDAIPIRFPHITWPQSVARHPSYMKLLASFDRVWAVSETSRRDLLEFWRWQGITQIPRVEVLALGADFNRLPRVIKNVLEVGFEPTAELGPSAISPDPDARAATANVAQLLCVGILEPRKNQIFLLEVAEALWREGLKFELHLVGRVNPHFGAPIVARIKQLEPIYPSLHFHSAASDEVLVGLYRSARATVFPTMAEGCGLPLLESLWMGLPCVASDLPVLQENAEGGGCLLAALNDAAAWKKSLREVVTDATLMRKLSGEAATRPLPTWRQAAEILQDALR